MRDFLTVATDRLSDGGGLVERKAERVWGREANSRKRLKPNQPQNATPSVPTETLAIYYKRKSLEAKQEKRLRRHRERETDRQTERQ